MKQFGNFRLNSNLISPKSDIILINTNLELSLINLKTQEIFFLNLIGSPYKLLNNLLFVWNSKISQIFDLAQKKIIKSIAGSCINEQIYLSSNDNNIFKLYEKDKLLFEDSTEFSTGLSININNHFFSVKKSQDYLKYIDLYNQSHHWEFDINVLRDLVPQWQDDRPNSRGQKPSDIKLGNRFYRYQDTVVTTVENPVFHDGRSAVRLIGIDVNNGQLKYISDYNCSRLIHNYESRLYMQQFRTIYEIDPQTGKIVSQLDFTDICSDLSASFLPELLHSEYNHFFAEQDFFIGEGVLCMAEFKDLNFVCIDLETKKVVFHHKFEKGKDIDAEAYRIETPIYHNGKVYVNTCDPTCLYVFELEK